MTRTSSWSRPKTLGQRALACPYTPWVESWTVSLPSCHTATVAWAPSGCGSRSGSCRWRRCGRGRLAPARRRRRRGRARPRRAPRLRVRRVEARRASGSARRLAPRSRRATSDAACWRLLEGVGDDDGDRLAVVVRSRSSCRSCSTRSAGGLRSWSRLGSRGAFSCVRTARTPGARSAPPRCRWRRRGRAAIVLPDEHGVRQRRRRRELGRVRRRAGDLEPAVDAVERAVPTRGAHVRRRRGSSARTSVRCGQLDLEGVVVLAASRPRRAASAARSKALGAGRLADAARPRPRRAPGLGRDAAERDAGRRGSVPPSSSRATAADAERERVRGAVADLHVARAARRSGGAGSVDAR